MSRPLSPERAQQIQQLFGEVLREFEQPQGEDSNPLVGQQVAHYQITQKLGGGVSLE